MAFNGLEALALLRGNGKLAKIPRERRLIGLALNMPKMNGIEFLGELRAAPELKQTSVIVITTSTENRDKVEAYNLNVAGYISNLLHSRRLWRQWQHIISTGR